MLQYTILDMVKRPFVIYKDTFTNTCCLEPRQGIINKKAMVIALPHSGVHLIQEIFSLFGLTHARVCHDIHTIGDYRFLSDNDIVNFSRLYDNYSLPFSETYKWITNGQFVHNKLKYDADAYFTLRDSDYVVYLLRRNLRDCVISHARCKFKTIFHAQQSYQIEKIMQEYIRTQYYIEILESVKLMLPWFENKTFDELEYESIVGTNGKDSQYRSIVNLIDDFEIKHVSSDDVISKCINKQTFSYSGNISNWIKYWNNDLEKWFIDTGLKDLNSKIGYT